jgi:DNA-binding LacI/PurR family transcriptional regulator
MANPPISLSHDGKRLQPGLASQLARPTIIMPPVPTRRPTITDVAKLCGVTPATVSRVLNNKKEFATTDAVRNKIWNTAGMIGYVPDLSARNLSRRSTHIIGLFASPQTHVAEGINESLIEGIASVLHQANYDVFFELSPAHSDHSLPFWRFDGAILMQSPKAETVTELGSRRVPYVCVNERVGRPVAHVLADDAMGMKSAIAHLTKLGHTHFAYANARAGYFSHYSVNERYDTLLAAARDKTIKLVAGHEIPFPDPAQFLRRTVLEGAATAIITYDHRIGVMILGAAYTLGIQIPADVSLICFNDVFPVALLHPPLTSVGVAGREMGRLGADLLLSSLRAAQPTAGKEIRVAEDLVVRGSTAPPPAIRRVPKP